VPVYEYRCGDCRKRSSLFFRSFNDVTPPVCPHCSSGNMAKLISRVVTIRSEESRLESLADPSALSGIDEDDPKSVAAWARKMGSEMGEDLGEDFDEMIDVGHQDFLTAMRGPGHLAGGQLRGGADGDEQLSTTGGAAG
jgi:putative FmdB family regulatory protein